MSDEVSSALRTAALIAFRHIDGLPEHEREQVLIALVATLPAKEGEIAQNSLYHLQQQRKSQLTLKAILDGIGGQDGDGNKPHDGDGTHKK